GTIQESPPIPPPALPETVPKTRPAPGWACTVRFSIAHKYSFMDVRVQVDNTTVFEKRFYGRTRKFTVFKVIERSVASGTFPLPRGDHVLVFQMDGEDETKTYSQAARCDEFREIRVRLENMKGMEVRALSRSGPEAPPPQ
ncbi:MAG: hypothetical protein NZ742_12655, partial [Acidobacteria bacterium]|nr:hypothetical protein [Acidobacteriota bacterium]MDW7985522.1 hypothetical protein [Acidobacteriota bacterium]